MYDFVINCDSCSLHVDAVRVPALILQSAVSTVTRNRVTGDAGQTRVHLCGCGAGVGRILVPSQASNGHASAI